ncbi:MAG TPA: CmcJ/NvfI family oxidoreductase [Acidimicrobiales bacterium]
MTIASAEVEKVRGEVNYLLNRSDDAGATLEFWSEDDTRSTMELASGQSVWIHNTRPERDTLDLDRNGFVLVDHRSAVSNFDMIQVHPLVDQHYAHEMAALLTEVTGADLVVVMSAGKKRYGEGEVDKLSGLPNAKPARYPHADNTDHSVVGLLGVVTDAFDVDGYPRWAAYNMWRAVTPPPQDIPLAVCDARTIAPGDEVTVTAVTTELSGDIRHDTTGYCYSEDHRWCYFRDMTPDEVLVFKAHDSDSDCPSRVAHTAFDDPSCPPGVATRASVETRAFAFFG